MKKRSVLSQFLFFFFFFATFDDFCGEQLPSFIITHPHPSLSLAERGERLESKTMTWGKECSGSYQ